MRCSMIRILSILVALAIAVAPSATLADKFKFQKSATPNFSRMKLGSRSGPGSNARQSSGFTRKPSRRTTLNSSSLRRINRQTGKRQIRKNNVPNLTQRNSRILNSAIQRSGRIPGPRNFSTDAIGRIPGLELNDLTEVGNAFPGDPPGPFPGDPPEPDPGGNPVRRWLSTRTPPVGAMRRQFSCSKKRP